MANPLGIGGMGFLGYVQFGRDATWGTFPTIDHRLPFFSANARAAAGRIQPKTMDGSIVDPVFTPGMQMGLLDISLPMLYEGELLIWDTLMGTETYGSNGGSTTGSLPYTHVFPNASATSILSNSLSWEIIEGGIGSTVYSLASPKCSRITGGKITKATMNWKAGVDIADQVGRLDLQIVGKSYTTNQTPTGGLSSPATPSYILAHQLSTNYEAVFNQSSTTSANTEDLTIEIEPMVKERPFMEGSGFVSEPQRMGRPQLTVTMTKQFQTRAALTAFLANSLGAGRINFQFSSGLQWQIDYFGQQPSFPEAEMNDEGWLTQKIVLKHVTDGSNTRFAITCVNTQSNPAA